MTPLANSKKRFIQPVSHPQTLLKPMASSGVLLVAIKRMTKTAGMCCIAKESRLVRLVAGKKTLEVTTRLGLQIRFADAESGEIKVGSGMGEATQYGQSFLKSLDMKFAQSTIGISTRKALETGCSRVITKMIKDGVFEK